MSAVADRRAYRAANVVLAACFAAAALVPRALSVTPDGEGLRWGDYRLPNLCFERHRTGQPCDSCRLGRAVVLAAGGAWGSSLAQHPAGLAVWGWVAAQALARAVLAWLAVDPRRWRLDAGLFALGTVLLWAVA